MSIYLTDEIEVKTKKGKMGGAKQIFLEGDTQTVEKEIKDINSRHDTLNTKHESLSKTVQGISATGKANTATEVTYNNTNSGITAENIQDAVDKLAAKNQEQDAAIGTKAEKSEVATELDKKFNKENIAQELGESKDKVVSQFALPFREIESPEFIKAIVDAEDHFLLGIQLDGSIEWGKGIPAPIRQRIQEVLNYVGDEFASLSDKIETIKLELTGSLQTYQQTTDATLANLQETKVDKEEGKSLIEDEVKECFRIIENEEFLKAIVDSDDKVLFGFYRATGKPYYPLNEMYHVIQNEEYFAAWLDADDKVALGIRRDGEIIGEIHAVGALKQVVFALQEKIDTIDSSLKEILGIFSLQEDTDYIAVEADADGIILSTTNKDGSHYIRNAKSETIPEEFSHIEDPERRMEIITDSEGKLLAERKEDGEKHEIKMDIDYLKVSNLNLQGDSVNDIQEALISNGFNAKTPIDWSNNSFIQIPEPHLAKINLTNINAMPTSKTDDFHAWLEFWDMQGNYFKKRVILNAQGNSSLQYVKKNFAADFCNDEWVGDDTFSIRIGAWVAQDSFHFKAYYAPDVFKGACPVSYKFMDEIVKTRGIINDRQWKRCLLPTEETIGVNPTNLENASIKTLLDDGARGFPDGFPCVVYLNDSFYGIFSWQLKKHRDNMHQDKGNASHIHLDGNISYQTITLADGNLDWDIINGKTPVGSDNNKDGIEIRNPKSLICIDGSKYDGDNNRKELIDEESPSYDSTNKNHLNSAKVKTSLIKFSTYIPNLKRAESEGKSESEIKNMIMQYFETDSIIDYIIFSDVVNNRDGFRKNWQWVSYDGNKFGVEVYDTDQILGSSGEGIISGHLGNTLDLPTGWIIKYMSKELESRYKVLRDEDIISVKNIINLLSNWCSRIGIENYKKEYNKWENSNVNDNIYRVSLWLDKNIAECDKIFNYL